MKIILIAFTLIVSTSVWCQSAKTSIATTQPTNVQRLNVDYEIKDVHNPSHDLLMQLNIGNYESLRKENENVEVYDAVSSYTIILYSKSKTSYNKTKNAAFQKGDSDHNSIILE